MRIGRAFVVPFVVLVALATSAIPAHAGRSEPRATSTPIEHVITLLQENHSFDNYFGTYPGADGIPPGICIPRDPADRAAGCVRPFSIGTRPTENLADNHGVFEAEYANGAMDGFVSALSKHGVDSVVALGHYDRADISYYWDIAEHYVLFDHYFASAPGGTLQNHMYWMTATPGSATERVPSRGFGTIPTIFDRLEAKGVSWKVYIEGFNPTLTFRRPGREPAQVLRAPLLAFGRYIDDPALRSHIVPLDEYYTDLAGGTLPAVSYIVPSGPSEHPPGRIASGEALVRNLVTSLKNSSAWSASAFMLSYDDWGGWYDHVIPPPGSGFRVPALLVSAYARRGLIDHTQLDHTSVLKFIETNWGLAPLSDRDAHANNLTSAFDFTQPPRPPELLANEAPSPIVVSGHVGTIYPAYGLAALVGAVLLSSAAFGTRRRRTHGAHA